MLDAGSVDTLGFAARRVNGTGVAMLFAVCEPRPEGGGLAGLPKLRIAGLAHPRPPGSGDRTRRVEGAATRVSEIVCECADERCAGTIRLRFDEYAALRAASRYFAVIPRHERSGAETVSARNLRFVVVRKCAAVA